MCRISKLRGYYGIGIYKPKTEENVGTLWRHAFVYQADFIFTIQRIYSKQRTDTLSAIKHIPLFHYDDYEDFKQHLPFNCSIVCIELADDSHLLHKANHPEQAVYLLGSEDRGLPEEIMKGNQVITIPSPEKFSLNVSTAGSIVMYDRYIKNLEKIKS